jgi:hypothetical protein
VLEIASGLPLAAGDVRYALFGESYTAPAAVAVVVVDR